MIGSIIRRARIARVRRQIDQVHERFHAEPDIQLVSNICAAFCDDVSKRVFATSIREGCEGALIDMGLAGPWADQERRTVAIGAMRSLLTDVVPEDVLDLAFSDEPLGGAHV